MPRTSKLTEALANIEWLETRVTTLDSMLAEQAAEIMVLRATVDRQYAVIRARDNDINKLSESIAYNLGEQIALVQELAQASKSARSLSFFLHS